MTKITLTNDFHGTSVNLVTSGKALSARQVRRSWKALCGYKGCACSNAAGTRGRGQYIEIEYSARTGQLLGATVPWA